MDSLDIEDKRRLELTQSTREMIVKTFISDGKIPDDVSSRTMLMQALDGLDRTTLGKAKIKAEDQAAKSNQDITQMMGRLLYAFNPSNVGQTAPVERKLETDISIRTVPGEMDLGMQTLTQDSLNS